MNIDQHRPQAADFFQTRRQFLNRFGMGMGALGMAMLMRPDVAESAALSPLAPRNPHFPAKAEHVIHVFAQGGPSHLDTWDPKPGMKKYAGKEVKEIGGVPLPTPFEFKPSGQSGVEVCELFPHIGKHIDDIAVIRSMHTDVPAHEFATLMMNTGSGRIVKPSMGSWTLYGLGTENQNLPGFVSLGRAGVGGSANFRSAFLPGAFQGTPVSNVSARIDDIIQNIRNYYSTQKEQRAQLDLVQKLNEQHNEQLKKEAELEARIHSYELAFQMQTEAAEAFDLGKEPAKMRQMYGETNVGRQMLAARRLVERGVRFVQVWANGWDHHTSLERNIRQRAADVDQPLGALMTDLKQRGLLEKTLIVWGGEFGRTPRHDRNGRGEPGRDHHSRSFVSWMAGGGAKGGYAHGASDEFGYNAVENKVHVHDLHATILKLLGFDHEKLTYRYNGRDFRLTDVYGSVVNELIA